MLLTNIMLSFIWMALTLNWTVFNFFLGFGLTYLFIAFIGRYIQPIGDGKYYRRVPLFVFFVFYFLYELFLASARVFLDAILPKKYMTIRPGIIAVPLTVKKDITISLLANCITLTPGTMSLEVSKDKKTLFVHSMYLETDPKKNIDEIKNGFERHLKDLFE